MAVIDFWLLSGFFRETSQGSRWIDELDGMGGRYTRKSKCELARFISAFYTFLERAFGKLRDK
jgi:hypothetical protein